MFQVFYQDGPAPPDTVPDARGVQAIVQDQEEVGLEITTGGDYYVWEEKRNRWKKVDIFGLYDYLLDSGLVLFGRTITRQEYFKVMEHALERQKVGWLPKERREE